MRFFKNYFRLPLYVSLFSLIGGGLYLTITSYNIENSLTPAELTLLEKNDRLLH